GESLPLGAGFIGGCLAPGVLGGGKRESGSWSIIRCRPEAPAGALDDGATDCKPASHALTFCGVESFKEPLRTLRSDPDPGVLYAQAYVTVLVRFAPDHHLPRAVVDPAHRIGGVAQQVHDHLLKLDTVAGDKWKLVGKFGAQNHPASLK